MLVSTFASGGAISLFPNSLDTAEAFSIRANSVSNFNFETDTTGWLVGASWNLNAGANITSDATYAIRGAKSGRVTTPGVTEAEGTEYSLGILSEGVNYTASAWVYLVSGTADLDIVLGDRGVAQAFNTRTIEAGWNHLQVSFNVTANNSYICIRTRFGISQNVTFYIDDVKVNQTADTAGTFLSFDVLPSGFSDEAFGTTALSHNVNATGIISTEAFGTPALQPAIVVTGISSIEEFGTSQINRDLSAGSVSSDEVFGTAEIEITVSPTGIVSDETFGATEATPSINPTGATSATAFGTARFDITIFAVGKGSDETFGEVNVSSYPIVPDGIVSAETFGNTNVIYTPLTTGGNVYISDIYNETEPAVLITDGVQTNVNGNVAIMTHRFTLEGRLQVGIYIDDVLFNGTMSITKNGVLNESEEIENIGWRYFSDLPVNSGDILDVVVVNY
jgi:hypothetical protein